MQNTITKILAFFLVVLLAWLAYDKYGYYLDGDIRAATSYIRHTAKDPDSIEFRALRKSTTGESVFPVVCGEYNGRNSFGAYVGFQPFYAMVMLTTVIVHDAEDEKFSLYCSQTLTPRQHQPQ